MLAVPANRRHRCPREQGHSFLRCRSHLQEKPLTPGRDSGVSGRRYYHPWKGRFLGRDPKEEAGGLNLYGFVGNNPITRWDYLGMCWSIGWGTSNFVQSVTRAGDIAPLGGQRDFGAEAEAEYDAMVNGTIAAYWANAAARIAQNVSANQNLITSDAMDLAMIADNVYSGRGSLPAHVQAVSPADIVKLGLDPNAFQSSSGFAAGLYLNTNTGQYVLAFRGTEGLQMGDWVANGAQSLGISTPQYNQAIALAGDVKRAAQAVGASFVSTGHSLGGGLASAAAIVTDTQAITFNAAGLHPATVDRTYGANLSNATNLVTAYYVRGEILSLGQDVSPLPNAAGTRIALAPGSSAGSATLHGMGQVLLAMGINPPGP